MRVELKAILLDLDDTIASYDAVSEQVWQELCRRFAPRIDGIEADQLYLAIKEMRAWYMGDKERHRYMRLNLEKARREIIGMSFGRLGIDSRELVNELADLYSVEREKATFLLPGAIDTLNHFKSNSIRLALLTNGTSKIQRRKIERFGVAQYFDFILIEEEMGFGKPDRRVFTRALEQLKVTKSDVWMVGDDLERDIGGAKELGIFTVWVDWRRTGLPTESAIKPDRIVNKISELVR